MKKAKQAVNSKGRKVPPRRKLSQGKTPVKRANQVMWEQSKEKAVAMAGRFSPDTLALAVKLYKDAGAEKVGKRPPRDRSKKDAKVKARAAKTSAKY